MHKHTVYLDRGVSMHGDQTYGATPSEERLRISVQ